MATSAAPATLTVQVPATLSGAVERAAGLWNANPPTSAASLHGPSGGSGSDPDERLANRFVARAGVAAFDGRSLPPFRVATALGTPDRIAARLLDRRVDLAAIDGGPGPRGPDPETIFGDRSDEVVGHRIAREGWAFVVSPAVAAAGVDALTPDQIRQVFAGETSNWETVGGPDREPFVFLPPEVDGVTLPYEAFLRDGDAAAPCVDGRYGRPDRLVAAAAGRDDAVGVVPAGGVWLARERGVSTLDVVRDGRRRPVEDDQYPLTAAVHLYTLGDPDARARAFLELLTSPFGQRELVGRDVLPVAAEPVYR